MSATNRGSERKPQDFYATPIDCVENFLDNYIGGVRGNILEPSAGNGNIITALRNKGIEGNITAIEIREEEKESLNMIADKVIIDNFLEWNTDKKFDVIIGNPPYSLAKEFIEKCFKISNENTVIIMLLRTAFLESKSRFEFWQEHPLTELHVLSKRPSFINGKTDATSYSWFVWDNRKSQQVIKVI